MSDRAGRVREIAQKVLEENAAAINGVHRPRKVTVTIWCDQDGEPFDGTLEMDTQRRLRVVQSR